MICFPPMKSLIKRLRLFLPAIVGFVYLVLLFVGLLSRDHGIFVSLQLHDECRQLENKIKSYRTHNEELKTEWYKLKHDMRYVEKIARQEMQMVSPGEVVFYFDNR